MRKAFYYLGILPYNGEPSRVWLVFGSVFFAWSTVRKRIQIDISWISEDSHNLDKNEKKMLQNIDLSI